MPRTRTLLATVALAASVTLAAPMAHAGADASPANYVAAYGADERPSCSLHPVRHDDGTVSFYHDAKLDPTEPRFLQIRDAAGTFVEIGVMLDPGAATKAYAIDDTAVITWAGHVYHVGAYRLENDCTEPTTTTTEPAPTTTIAPPTTTTIAPPTTTTEAPPSTTSSTEAPPVSVFNPTTTSVGTPPPAVPASDTDSVVAGRVETRRLDGQLPTTGADSTILAAVAAALLLAGASVVMLARRVRGRHLEHELGS